ncbi:MAG: electron transfer flavoprotein subunit alpha/FixB family protein [Dehalococcoidia bacterium]|nr:electron transfer flavoprotein subunit alpha/FixB family protein [Dehalococcoidia bacterium]
MSEVKGVLVIGEVSDGKLLGVTRELLGIGRKLADTLGEHLSAAILGAQLGDLGKELVAYGADKAYLVQDPLLAQENADAYVAAAEKVVRQVQPNVLLLGQTVLGRDISPRLATRLGTALAPDCVELAIDPATKLLHMTRPVYGGNARAIYVCEKARPQMATVRPKAFSVLERNDARAGEVVQLAAGLDPAQVRVKVLDRQKKASEGLRLEDARVVVTGGRGMGGPENFKYLDELAKTLKGAVGASRAVCDAGWVSPSLQIGLTGKVVTPDLYITVGISGASQHMAGCSGSKVIVAINKDPDANIFKEARYGVVGDWKQVLPALTEKVKELVQG